MVKPNVLCIGFAKCGTTTLHNIMKQHKDIFFPGIKEPAYYTKKNLYKKGFEWYQKRYYPKKVKEKIIMEVNPLLGKRVEASTIKKDYGKNTKIIILIREPMERLYSNFKMNLVSGSCFPTYQEHLDPSTAKLFHNWMTKYYNAKEMKFKSCAKTNIIASGEYYKVIKDYINVFGKNNIKVIVFEDFVKDPHTFCKDIYKFIGIKDDDTINYYLHSNEGTRIPRNKLSIKINRLYYDHIYNRFILPKVPYISNSFCQVIDYLDWSVRKKILSKNNQHPEKMLKEDKELLREYYYKDIQKLSKLLDIDLIEKWNMQKTT